MKFWLLRYSCHNDVVSSADDSHDTMQTCLYCHSLGGASVLGCFTKVGGVSNIVSSTIFEQTTDCVRVCGPCNNTPSDGQLR